MARHKRFGEYPFVFVAALVAALTVGLVVLGLELYWGYYAYLLVLIPVAIAGYYLVSFSRTAPAEEEPGPPAAASPETAGAGEEPFVDPVEEADRLASGETLPPSPPD